MGRKKKEIKVPHTFNFDKLSYYKLKKNKVNVTAFINEILSKIVTDLENNNLHFEIISRTIGVDEEKYKLCKSYSVPINRILNAAIVKYAEELPEEL